MCVGSAVEPHAPVAPNKRMQAARAKAIWYGHSMLTGVDKVPLLGRGDAREPDAGRWATQRRCAGG